MKPAIPPPPRMPIFDPWHREVDQKLEEYDERIRSIESDAACAHRTECKVDDLTDEMRELKSCVMRVLEREADQERDIGSTKAELAKVGASSGRKWGAVLGAIVAGLATIIERMFH